jgi:nucleoside 2-deoxyribosyltransferase
VKIYIAAPYVRLEEARLVADALRNAGHQVTSRWLVGAESMNNTEAQKDLDDVDACDVLLALNPVHYHREGGGRHAELGYALARNKRVILCGSRSIIFHYLDRVELVADISDLTALLPVETSVSEVAH